MKITQKFSPVTIVLETSKELDILWGIIEKTYSKFPMDTEERNLLIQISNGFSEVGEGNE